MKRLVSVLTMTSAAIFSIPTLAVAQDTVKKSGTIATPTESTNTTNTETIYLHDKADCSDGHYSFRCGWPEGSFYDNEGGGGGGGAGGGRGGGGGGSFSGADGSTGKAMDRNRLAGCQRELDFMSDVVGRILTTGNFVGTQVPIIVTDPLFGDGQWFKFQDIGYNYDWSRSDPAIKLEFKFVVHYMYNISTGQVHQVKLKNSYEYGCKGFPVPRTQ